MEDQQQTQRPEPSKYETFKRYFPYVCLVALAAAYLKKDVQYNELQQAQTTFWRDAFVRINDAYNDRQRAYDYRENPRRYYVDSNQRESR